MTLLYAATFTKALDRLTAAEQKQVKIATVDLALDPSGNGLQLHRVEAAPSFWTARVSQDIRLVLHKEGERTLLAWVGHHDEAYRWAERRRLVPHERTGAMQLVEIVERTEQRLAPAASSATAPAPPPIAAHRPFAGLSDDDLLNIGVPRDWLDAVRQTEEVGVDALFASLPDEAAEALLDVATGGRIEDHIAARAAPGADPFAHPDARRRFRQVEGIEELRAALDAPWAAWTVFLHPAQRALVERAWRGPARVTGGAGTGKTIVALHRAARIARDDPGARVLLTTFSRPLAEALSAKLATLTDADPATRARIEVRTLDQAAHELYARLGKTPQMAPPSLARAAIEDARRAGLGGTLSPAFLLEEWEELVDAWGVADADAYAKTPRTGRRTRLGAAAREQAWGVFAFVRQRLADRGAMTWADLYRALAAWVERGGRPPFSHVVVDEAQDLSVAQVRFLATLAASRPDALFLAGDIGQRIFRLPFSWAKLGLDLRGRSHRLRVNYRTSHQIRERADRLLPRAIVDADGVEEGRGAQSVFDGPAPEIRLFADAGAERDAVGRWLAMRLGEGAPAQALGVLVRGQGQLDRARAAVRAAGLDWRAADGVRILAMHDAKGLEFAAVAVMAVDEDVLPDPLRLATLGDGGELEAAYETERHLLYVACTRARDHLLVTGVGPGSEFLDDLGLGG
ncbi:MAG: AAA family ATPase [Sphingomonas sp.]|nr:AAA family ATPase [Sphingomonas sp.]OQW48246.1 MAG: hypothetical protein A4S16_00845 [Proteobacteria bacterium SG_bin6]